MHHHLSLNNVRLYSRIQYTLRAAAKALSLSYVYRPFGDSPTHFSFHFRMDKLPARKKSVGRSSLPPIYSLEFCSLLVSSLCSRLRCDDGRMENSSFCSHSSPPSPDAFALMPCKINERRSRTDPVYIVWIAYTQRIRLVPLIRYRYLPFVLHVL